MAMTKRKQKTVRAKAKTGLSGVPIDKGFAVALDYFHMNVDRKDLINIMKSYVKKNMDKEQARYVLSCPEYKFYAFTHKCCTAFWIDAGLPSDDQVKLYSEGLYKHLIECTEMGKCFTLKDRLS